MGSNWLSIDNNFPTFTGQESLREQVRLLHDFIPILIEGLKYQLNNLDGTNWNAKAKERFQKETTEELEDAMDTTDAEVARLIRSLEGLTQDMDQILRQIASLGEDVGWLEERTEDLAERTEDLEERQDSMSADLDELQQLVRVLEDGSIQIGTEGVALRLTGTVYINDVAQ